MEYYTLNTGDKIPVIAGGVGIPGYSARKRSSSSFVLMKMLNKIYDKFLRRPLIVYNYVNATANQFREGFVLLDYSSSYGDGKLIGKAIKKSGLSRSELFITTRVSNVAQMNGTVRACIEEQIKNMGVGYVDLLMFHWPVTDRYLSTWREMVQMQKDGLCRNLGVANCHQHHIEAIIRECGVVPAVNQVEVHPLFTQIPLRDYCRSKGIQVESYSATARMDDRLMRLPKLKAIAKKYGKTVVQVVLRWHIQNGLIPCVRSHNPKRQRENINIFDFQLSAEEMEIIDGFNIDARVRYNPDNCDFSIL